MPLATGVDLVHIPRIAAAIARHGERFLHRVYTPAELIACGGRVESLAARWAAKEAVAKALGAGVGPLSWREIEVVHDDLHAPAIRLYGAAAALAAARGLTQWSISLSHDAGLAVAFVVGL